MPGILFLSQPPLPFPLWARPGRSAGGPDDPASASFQAGAGLALIGLVLSTNGPATGVWLDRLALSAAAARHVRRVPDTLSTRAREFRASATRTNGRHLKRLGDKLAPELRRFWREQAERIAGLNIEDVWVGFSAGGLVSDVASVEFELGGHRVEQGDIDALLAAGRAASDPVWRLPLHAGYAGWLDSQVADLNNVSAKPMAGAIIGALFLQRFVSAATKWAHLDLYAWNDGPRPGRPEGGETQAMRAVAGFVETFAVSTQGLSR